MKKSKRAEILLIALEKLYPEVKPPLDFHDHYTLLIAVLLSAQCTDERVNKVTPALFARAKTPQEMVLLSIEEIHQLIKSCGLAPKKSRAIFELSQMLIDQYDGQVPMSFEELEKLPGVGHKTASVVMSQGFGVPAFPVDTHIHRLATRWKLTSGKNVEQTEADLKKLFPENCWNKLHLQIIFYGREFCQARKCFGKTCPLCSALSSGTDVQWQQVKA